MMDQAKDWEISKNGTTIGWLRKGKIQDTPGLAVGFKVVEPQRLEITFELNDDVTIIVRAVN